MTGRSVPDPMHSPKGDTILTINGETLGEDPLTQLDGLLRHGSPIVFGVRREGKQLDIEVRPEPS